MSQFGYAQVVLDAMKRYQLLIPLLFLFPLGAFATWDTLIVANVGAIRAIVADTEGHACILGPDLKWWDAETRYWKHSLVPPIPADQYPQFLYLVPDGTIWASGQQSLPYRSDDNGKSFTLAPTPEAGAVYVSPVGDLILRPRVGDPNYLRSTDGGLTWDSLSATGAQPFFDQTGNMLIPSGSRTIRIWRDTGSVDTLPYLDLRRPFTTPFGRNGIARLEISDSSVTLHTSFDAGSTWQSHGPARNASLITELIGTQDGQLYAVGSTLLHSSDSGSTWTAISSPASALAPPMMNPEWLADSRRIWQLKSGEWIEADTGLCVNYIYNLYSRGDTILLNSIGEGIIRSTDDGKHFKLIYNDSAYYSDIVQTPSGSLFIENQYAASPFVLRSIDGVIWQRVALQGGGVGFADSNGKLYHPSSVGLEESVDEGLTWSVSPWHQWFGWTAMFPEFFLVFDNDKVHRSIDEGKTWSTKSWPPHHNLPKCPVGGRTKIARYFDNVYVATDSSFYYSTDAGLTWQEAVTGLFTGLGALTLGPIHRPLGLQGVSAISEFDPVTGVWHQLLQDSLLSIASMTASDRGILIGTYGGPLYRIPYTDLPLSVGENATTQTSSVYPNPTTGKFRLDAISGTGRLFVEDPLGRTLLEAEYRPDMEIDVSALPSSTYYYRLISDHKTFSGSFVKRPVFGPPPQ